MTELGIIGSGAIGAGLARLATQAGHRVTIANSRGPESLAGLASELGSPATAGTVEQAATAGELTILAVPLGVYHELPVQVLQGRVILSTGNYYPFREGRIPTLDSLETTTAEYEQSLLPGASVMKAFNNIAAHHIPLLAGSEPRTALPVAGDDAEPKRAVMRLVDSLGFEPVDAGSLAESWRFEPESGAYTGIYFAGGAGEDYLADRGAPVSAEQLKRLLAASRRPDVGAREF